jgi:uncharacterized protein YndB with AHSA1/START domain
VTEDLPTMAEVSRTLPYPPSAVYTALADPEAYPNWVVGAQRIRDVEGDWPEPGARFHHVVGLWPLRLRDSTEVLEAVPDARLVLEARARPMGRARVELELHDRGPATEVVMREAPVSGPGRLVPRLLLDPTIRRRNEASLDRLQQLLDQRAT